jgi:tryptophan 2,3-dioxygenase
MFDGKIANFIIYNEVTNHDKLLTSSIPNAIRLLVVVGVVFVHRVGHWKILLTMTIRTPPDLYR